MPVNLRDVGLEPVLIVVLARGFGKVADHFVDVVFERRDFALRFHRDGARQVAFGDGGGDIGDGAHLSGQVGGELIDVIGKIAPDSGGAGHARLAAQLAFDADFAGHVADLIGEDGERVDHAVDGVGEFGDFAFGLEHQFAFQISVGDGGHHFGDTANLRGQIRGHEVDVVGKIFPRAGDAAHFGLAAELAFGADFARHARHFRGEGVELIDHGVDGVFQLQNFALHIDRDLAAEVAVGHGGGHLGDVADLRGQIAGHGVHAVGQILPGAGDAAHFGLAAQLAFGADFARHASHFGGEGTKLIHHRVDGVFQLQNFAAHIDRDLARQIALGDGRGDFGDVADLVGEVGRPWSSRSR